MSQTVDPKPGITPAPNGPYIVKNLNNLANAKGPIEAGATVALCRCGQSANKPFCDGTHAKVGFSDAKLPDRRADELKRYAGKEGSVSDNRGICAHAGYCTNGLDSVFRFKEDPPVDPNGATADEITAIVRKCPSGAIGYTLGGAEQRDQDRPPGVFVAPNGPYAVSGGVALEGVERGEDVSTEHFTLCRCGASKNKPFCDGSHWSINFKAD